MLLGSRALHVVKQPILNQCNDLLVLSTRAAPGPARRLLRLLKIYMYIYIFLVSILIHASMLICVKYVYIYIYFLGVYTYTWTTNFFSFLLPCMKSITARLSAKF